MNEIMTKIFGTPEIASVQMELFSVWHIIYVILIVSFPFVLYFGLKNAEYDKKTKALRAIAIAIFVLYIGDFFIQPFYNDGNLIVDKLPFHICTFLCPVIMLAQFSGSKKIAWFYDAIALLAIVGPFMYFVYPNTAFGDNYTPWCYRVVQTFLYHGLVYSWGVSALLFRRATCKYIALPKVLIIQAFITLWATFGNWAYDHNWYFLKGLDMGFVEFKYPLTYLIINLGVFLMVMIVFAIEKLVLHIAHKREEKQVAVSKA